MAGRSWPAEMLAAEAAFRREIAPWALLGLTLGLVEGATAAVLIKKTFAGAASPWIVNLAVAFVSGAPALSNVISFVWANLAHGRTRIRLMVALQAAFALLVGLLGVAPGRSAAWRLPSPRSWRRAPSGPGSSRYAPRCGARTIRAPPSAATPGAS